MILSDKLFVFHISFPIRRNGDKKQAVSGASGQGRDGEFRESSSSPTSATSGAESTGKARRWRVQASRSKAVIFHSTRVTGGNEILKSLYSSSGSKAVEKYVDLMLISKYLAELFLRSLRSKEAALSRTGF